MQNNPNVVRRRVLREILVEEAPLQGAPRKRRPRKQLAEQKTDPYIVIPSAFSALATYCLVWVAALTWGDFTQVWKGLSLLLTGRALSISAAEPVLEQFGPEVLVVLAVDIPVALLGVVIALLAGVRFKGREKPLQKMFLGNISFGMILRIILLEELFARWLFLGVLHQLPLLDTTAGFYFLFMSGNGIWALLHLKNFKDRGALHPFMVMPQFLTGILFTYIFVRHGLIVTTITHFAVNAILFSTMKHKRVDRAQLVRIACYGVMALVAWMLMKKPAGDAIQWLQKDPVFALPGWTFLDYLAFDLWITGLAGFVMNVLLYDDTKYESFKLSWELLVAIFIAPLFILALYFAVNLVVESPLQCAMVVSLVISMSVKVKSGSATANIFWRAVTSMPLFIFIIQAIGVTSSILLMLISTCLTYPLEYLKQK